MYFTCILKSEKDQTLYIGITKNLRKRVIEHKNGETPFTKGRGPYRLIFFAAFPSKDKAAKLERYLKSGSDRAFIKRHIV